ncbi:hypothetical protein Ancab_036461 [Ancistrocladus abbreviatus]
MSQRPKGYSVHDHRNNKNLIVFIIMFTSKPNISPPQCRRHPKHRQSPGVCSICLTEKLSKLPACSSNITATTPKLCYCAASSSYSSSCSSLTSSEISSYESPQHHYMPSSHRDRGNPYRHFASAVRTKGPMIDVLSEAMDMAAISSHGDGDGDGGSGGSGEAKNHGKKKSGLWLKWLRPRRKRNDVHHHQIVMHSQPIAIRKMTDSSIRVY